MLKFRATAGSGWKVDQPLETMKFPAGEVHIKTSADDEIYTPELAVWIAEHDKLNDDLVTLAMYADYVRQRGMEPKLYVPYFPGARQDRGAPFGAKVYADLVNTMGFSEVTILDPHSPTIVGLIDMSEFWMLLTCSCEASSPVLKWTIRAGPASSPQTLELWSAQAVLLRLLGCLCSRLRSIATSRPASSRALAAKRTTAAIREALSAASLALSGYRVTASLFGSPTGDSPVMPRSFVNISGLSTRLTRTWRLDARIWLLRCSPRFLT